MCFTGDSSSTHAAQILQLPRGPKEDASPSRQTNHPFSDTHLSYPPHLPPLCPYRWMTLRPARVSCAKGAPCTPALGPEPQRKSGTVHRGNPALPGVPAQAGTICPRPLTQKQNCQGGFPLTWCTPQAMQARSETGDRSITAGVWRWWKRHGIHLVNSSSVWEWADTREEWTPFSTITEIPYGKL